MAALAPTATVEAPTATVEADAASTPTTAAPPSDGRLRMTYEEFQAWYDREAGRRGELVNGEVIEFLAPKMVHQRVSRFLTRIMDTLAADQGLGEVVPTPEMKLEVGGTAYREPDITFVAAENAGRVTADGIDGPADLVVEIVSDDSVKRDKVEKRAEYELAGVREYWVVDPRPLPPDRARRRTVVAYALTEEGAYEPILPDAAGRLPSTVLPGLAIDPAWVRRDPLPDPRAALAELAGEPAPR